LRDVLFAAVFARGILITIFALAVPRTAGFADVTGFGISDETEVAPEPHPVRSAAVTERAIIVRFILVALL
jgi:hypothetical protein